MAYILTLHNLHIKNSYATRKWKMRPYLEAVKKWADLHKVETVVFERSFFSLKMEWIAHNFLYEIGYERERTKDCDLDNPCDRPEWLYIVCGLAVWLFVW